MVSDINTANNHNEQNHPPIDAEARVRLESESMVAILRLYPPQYGGKQITYDKILEAIKEANVVAGINEKYLESLKNRPIYNIDFKIAQGKYAEKGEDGFITYHFDTSRDLLPKDRGDGTVDFKELGYVTNVNEGDLLCEIVPGKDGVDGYNVCGVVLPSFPGKTPAAPNGKNTRLSQDSLKVFATVSGQIQFHNNVVSVDEVLTIREDVGPATGNINFVGSVTVYGDVREGFEINASGNVTIRGMVEGANITSGGSILLSSGMNGMFKGHLKCKGDLKAIFIEASNIEVEGKIVSESIINSKVFCKDHITMVGRHAVIIGGEILCKKGIRANNIGSNSNTPTHIEIKSYEDYSDEKKEIPLKINEIKEELAKVKKIFEAFDALRIAKKLTPDKEDTYESLKINKRNFENKIFELENRLKFIEDDENSAEVPMVIVKKNIYPNVRIVIDNAIMNISELREHSTLYKHKGEIVFGTAAEL